MKIYASQATENSLIEAKSRMSSKAIVCHWKINRFEEVSQIQPWRFIENQCKIIEMNMAATTTAAATTSSTHRPRTPLDNEMGKQANN